METLYEVVGNYIEPWIPCCDGFCSEQDQNELQYYQSAKGVRKTIGYYKTMKEARESKEKHKNQHRNGNFKVYKNIKIVEHQAIELKRNEYALIEKKIVLGNY